MNNFLNITINLSEAETYARDLDDDLRIEKNNISEEMMKQAGKFAWWSTLCALAEDRVARMKRDFEVTEATLSNHYRNELSKDGKKVTEKEIDAAVKLDVSFGEMKNLYLDAVKQHAILDSAKNAFNHRKDMLRSLSMERGVGMDMDVLRDAVKTIINEKK